MLDVDGLIDFVADDGILRFPYSTGLAPESIQGSAAIREYLSQSYQAFESVVFSNKNVVIEEETRTVVVTMEGKFQLKGGGEYANTYIHLVKYTEEGKILELAEYFNPYNVAKAFGVLDKLRQ